MQTEVRPGRRLWVDVQRGSSSGRFSGCSAVALFVHGACAHSQQFQAQRDALLGAGLDTVLYDQLGCGQSAKPRSPATVYHPDELTADLHAILQAYTQGYENVYMIGHSFGTSEVIRLMAEAGQQVRGVVLLAAVWPEAIQPASDRLFSLPEFVLGWLQRTLTQGFLLRAFHPDGFKERPQLIEAERTAANSNPPYMFKAFYTQSNQMWHPRDRFLEWTRAVTAPTLVICGEEDRITPLQMSRDLAAALPNARLVTIPSASHQVMQEKPEEVNRLLLELMQDTLGTSDP